jgi:hypothetical protein
VCVAFTLRSRGVRAVQYDRACPGNQSRDQNPEKAQSIERWLDQVAAAYNILSLDGEIFREWAKMMHNHSDTLYEDCMIAACARVNKLTVVTRNVRDFKNFGVKLLNPFI